MVTGSGRVRIDGDRMSLAGGNVLVRYHTEHPPPPPPIGWLPGFSSFGPDGVLTSRTIRDRVEQIVNESPALSVERSGAPIFTWRLGRSAGVNYYLFAHVVARRRRDR